MVWKKVSNKIWSKKTHSVTVGAMAYTPTIGLEIHAELNTQTKMFCVSKNDANENRPNVNICPVCMAHPGTLPVINREAVHHVLRVGTAVNGAIADYTEFDRKNYFYPDIPKGYQISQYEYPLVSGGELAGVKLTRIHLEEDTARSAHDNATGLTHLDYNRAGVPLMELVTDPVIKSAEEAGMFARELQLLLRYMNASNANMEKGEMRVEANISVSNTNEFGTKVEVKNLNSFRSVERAIQFEIKRQIELLERGEKVVQETRGWDDAAQKTFSQRKKEIAADYRYFPDPDLPSLKISEIEAFDNRRLQNELPELPDARRKRYAGFGLKSEDTELFVRDTAFGDFFDSLMDTFKAGSKELTLAANYLANDVVQICRDIASRDTKNQAEILISRENFIAIIVMLTENKISSRGAKDLLKICSEEEVGALSVATERGLLMDISEERLAEVVNEVVTENSGVVDEYRAGKHAVIQFLIGQVMKKLKGAGDPNKIRETLIAHLR